ncbi:MAG: antibiotic biosynthesis monooxygenase [Actinomycetota bacterium]|nr:antibiotic biosynthesis monooxygenase [Actinomycetota bacterium]
MTEISTVALITAKPGSGDDVGTALRELAAATHGEDGCLQYSLHRGLQEPDVFLTIEKWRSKADLDAHLSSPHLQAALAAAGELLAEQPRIIPAQPMGVGADGKGAF